MGANLTLRFVSMSSMHTHIPVLESIEVPQDYRVYGLLSDFSFRRQTEPEVPPSPLLRSVPLPGICGIVCTPGAEPLHEDAGGRRLEWAPASEFVRTFSYVTADISDEMRAVFERLAKFPQNCFVVLDWH